MAILITGLPGSGKSVISDVLKSKGIPVFIMGEMVFREAKKRYNVLNSKTVARTAKEIREEFGPAAVAILTLKAMRESGVLNHSDVIAIEGLRSPSEYNYFRENLGSVALVAVVASQEERYNRLKERIREDKEKDEFEFFVRDLREINFGISELIPLADLYIFNEKHDLEKFRENVELLLNSVLEGEKWSSN